MDEGGWDLLAGRRLKALREQRRWTQEDLAERAGISNRATIAAMEAGTKAPRLVRLKALAGALGVTVSELLGETPLGHTPHITSTVTGDHNLVQNIDRRPFETAALLEGFAAVLQAALQDLGLRGQVVPQDGRDGG